MHLAHVSFSGAERTSRGGQRREHSAATGGDLPAVPSKPPTMPELVVRTLQQFGIEASAYRAGPVRRRLPACLRHLRVSSEEAAEQLLARTPALAAAAVDSLLIGVSSFFRDPAVFDALRGIVLPELLRVRRGIGVYAAGVSTGQELYSVAILLDEAGALEHSELLGVDCRARAIAQAGAGAFTAEELSGLSETRRDTYFPLCGTQRAASASLRLRLAWRCGDLLQFEPPPGRQLILFRNVAIYLGAAAAGQVWGRLAARLEPGGFLVTGKAEQPPRTLPLQRVAPCIYRRTQS
jgi:chemotaxis protein methyltransferase CheR